MEEGPAALSGEDIVVALAYNARDGFVIIASGVG